MKKLSARSLNVLRNVKQNENSMRSPGAKVKASQIGIAMRLERDGLVEQMMTPNGYRWFTTSRADLYLE